MEYLLKSSAILFIFYLFYKLFLQKETFFQRIRIYLLTGLVASLILPLIIIPEYVTVNPVDIPLDLMQADHDQTIVENSISWQSVLMIIYFLGVAFFLFRFLFRLISVLSFVSSHKSIRHHKYNLIKTDKNISPFSFFNYIVYNDSMYSKKELDQILIHEKVHVKQLHSFDHLLSQLVSAILWFNPFSWLFTKEIQKNLEFIADEHAQYFTKEKKTYQYLLLKTTATDLQPVPASNFYNSLIKKRIDMLQKKRSGKIMQLKFILVIPVLIAFVFTFNTKVIAQQKKGSTVKTGTEKVEITEIITKDTKNSELDIMKEEFARYDSQFRYKKLKRNQKSEIISISITVKNKAGNEAKLSQNGTKPISPIKIVNNITTGEVSVGNVSDKNNSTHMYFTSQNEGTTTLSSTAHSNSFITNDDGKVEIFVINSDQKEAGNNSKLIVTTDKKGKEKKYVITVNSDDLDLSESEDKNINVWISTDGDTLGVKKIKIISTGDKAPNIETIETEVITVKKGDLSKDGNVFIFKSDDEINASNEDNKMVFNTSGKKPLFFLDGKEITEKEMKDIDTEKIKSINVLKGKMAIDKYGAKAKDGVVEIKTKK